MEQAPTCLLIFDCFYGLVSNIAFLVIPLTRHIIANMAEFEWIKLAAEKETRFITNLTRLIYIYDFGWELSNLHIQEVIAVNFLYGIKDYYRDRHASYGDAKNEWSHFIHHLSTKINIQTKVLDGFWQINPCWNREYLLYACVESNIYIFIYNCSFQPYL